MADGYSVSEATARRYCDHVVDAIHSRFEGSSLVDFPSDRAKLAMVREQVTARLPLPGALFYLDGTKRRVRGSNHEVLQDRGHKWRAAVNLVIVFNRYDMSICCFNRVAAAGRTHDKILYDELFDGHPERLHHLRNFPALADKGFVGAHSAHVATHLRNNMEVKRTFTKSFWNAFGSVRAGVENRLADFFHRQFRQLSLWEGTGSTALEDFDDNMFAGACLWNFIHRTDEWCVG